VKSSGGYDSLVCETKGCYIWVPNDALRAYKKNPDSIFLALTKRSRENRINAVWVSPSPWSLEDAIEKAKELNSPKVEVEAN
jgi:hypothetical protein